MTKEANAMYAIRNYYGDLPPIFDAPKEPKIKVSPYAKFDKFHHKKKKRND